MSLFNLAREIKSIGAVLWNTRSFEESMTDPNSCKIVCIWAELSLPNTCTSTVEDCLSFANLGSTKFQFCTSARFQIDLFNSWNYYVDVIDLATLSIMSFESMNFVQNWVRTSCLKFWWWIFLASIHACCDVFWWNACWFLLCDVRSLQWCAWFAILDMLKFSGNSRMKIFRIFIMFIITCIFSADFARTFIHYLRN